MTTERKRFVIVEVSGVVWPPFDGDSQLQRYSPYLDHVQGGSIAEYKDMAKCLESGRTDNSLLAKQYSPGRLPLIILPLGLIFAYLHRNTNVIEHNYLRFAFHVTFLGMNIFYLMAVDFAVWNLSLDGYCKTTRSSSPNYSMRHLGG